MFIKKDLMVDAIVNENLHCGKVKYFDFDCDEDYFRKYLQEKTKEDLEEILFNDDFHRCQFFDYFVSKGMLEIEDKEEYEEMYGLEVFNSEIPVK